MKKKNYFLIFIITFIILTSPNVFATENYDGLTEQDGKIYYYENGSVYKGFKEIGEKMYFFSYATGQTKTGWQSIDGINWFYCNNDGTIKRNELATIDGKTHYFDENGYKTTGFKTINNKLYFFSYITATTKIGWQSIDGINWFYCNNDGTVKRNEFATIDGKTHYFDENGYKTTGFKTINNKLYFFSYVTATTKTGWQSIDGIKWFYCNNDGTVKKNELATIDKKTYYFDENGYRYGGFKTINNKLYFFSYATGQTKTGWQSIDGINKFYCNDDGTVQNGGKKVINNSTYYFKNDGYAYRGLIEIDGKLHYFSYDDFTLNTKKGFYSFEDKTIYCDESGFAISNVFTTIDGSKYYFDENGYRYSGFKVLENEDGEEKTYFFSYATGKTKTGLQTIDGIKYFYCDTDGSLISGFKKIGSKVYYFSIVNYMSKTGWQSIDGISRFYCNDDGTVVTGFKVIDGTPYYFSMANYFLKQGWQSIDGINWFYCNDDGTVATSFKQIDDKLYYFSVSNYFLKKGWQTLDNYNFFYCNDDGTVATGNVTIESVNYNFSSEGFVEGFYTSNGIRYYKDPTGSIVKGMKRMCGRYFIFDDTTGAFTGFGNAHQVLDVSHHQGTLDINAWRAILNTGTVDAVIVRAGFSYDGYDRQFVNNINVLNQLNVPYTVYLFSYAENASDALKEADFLISQIKNNNVKIHSGFTIYYDLEPWSWTDANGVYHHSGTISKQTYHEIITTFINRVESVLGIRTRIYASKSYVTDRFLPDDYKYATWIAQWPYKGQNYFTWDNQCTYQYSYEGWQYSDASIINGITFDRNIFYY